jgi:hypothetical protein
LAARLGHNRGRRAGIQKGSVAVKVPETLLRAAAAGSEKRGVSGERQKAPDCVSSASEA